ncbi:hypothetical protein [Aestuariivivens sediminicola]|uniref:hypothetical protein n=1 Tax=Aestuariivivens sediminicola TaxID=2913560 RepID=UPI001F5761C7|nr:hypothetical protein [Aestuariivivens sediminicola]
MKKLYPYAHWWLLLGFIIVIAGFIPSYWTKDLASFNLSVHIHGLSATLWFIILILQPLFINLEKYRTHRFFGYTSLIIATVVAASAAVVTPHNITINYGDPNLSFMIYYVDLIMVAAFVFFIMMGIHHRKNMQLHSRYLVCTVFIPIQPALVRLLIYSGLGFEMALQLGNAIIVAAISLMIWDDYKKGRIYPPYLLAYIIILSMGITFHFVGCSNWWQNLIENNSVLFVWIILLGLISTTLIFLKKKSKTQ